MAALLASQLILTWSSEPLNKSQHTKSISRCPSPKQNFLPPADRRDTRMSVPRCARSCSATMPPKKVSQTNNQRDNSSDTAIPEFRA